MLATSPLVLVVTPSCYLFELEFCNVASSWKKGVVEKSVQDGRRRIGQ
jgi:hypothetical protein